MKCQLTAAQAAAISALEALKQSPGGGSTAEGAMDPVVADHVWGLVKSRIASHMIDNYQARVEAKCKELA